MVWRKKCKRQHQDPTKHQDNGMKTVQRLQSFSSLPLISSEGNIPHHQANRLLHHILHYTPSCATSRDEVLQLVAHFKIARNHRRTHTFTLAAIRIVARSIYKYRTPFVGPALAHRVRTRYRGLVSTVILRVAAPHHRLLASRPSPQPTASRLDPDTVNPPPIQTS
ncbi:hypothetical protein K440DRAFT_214625 [Wilcoxina mikolae CBS 423.85]|nr:hypothetical protein K440DRAFT_214625 [Wilcoxina mikolae CBS 423.85]